MGHDYSLITLAQLRQPAAPLIITVSASEHTAAMKALEQGVFNCLVLPVEPAQAVPTVQRALWLYQLRVTVARRKHTLELLRQRREALLAQDHGMSQQRARVIERSFLSMIDTVTACERSMAAIEKSLSYLSDTALAVAAQAREQAFHRLMAPKR